MVAKVASFLFLLAQILVGAFALPVNQTLEARQSVSTLSAAEIASYMPYTSYAAVAYCRPESILAWDCGPRCASNPQFIPIASGGNGASIQYWYVGYDPLLQTIVVGYQGTDSAKILPLITVINAGFQPLDSSLFPGVSSSIETHGGFGDAHAASANAVLAAVRTGLLRYNINRVTLTGHSLGGAIAIIATAHLAVQIPGIQLRTITYASPRVGNQAFVDFVNARSVMNRINNKRDPVPIFPGRFLNFAHTEGEIHITDSDAWISCPGQDNTNSQCTIGYIGSIVGSILSSIIARIFGGTVDHRGPYDGVILRNSGCS